MMLSALSVVGCVIRSLPVNALTPQYSGFMGRVATFVCTVVLNASTTIRVSGVGSVVIYGKEKRMIKDSGERREFESGAVRDIQEGKGRCDLLPLDVVSDCFRFGGFNEAADVFGYIYEFQQTRDVKFLLWAIDAASIFNNSWTEMFLEVSKHFEEGAKKYGENNWQKGLPVNCYIDSAVRHFLKHLHGDTDEPHDRAFVWNLMCCVWTVKHIENGGNNHDYE